MGLPEWKRVLLRQLCRTEPGFPKQEVQEEPFDLNAAIRELCPILSDPTATEEEKYATLTTIGDALFPERPIFRDITDASVWPPSPEEIDAVLTEFRETATMGDKLGDGEGADDSLGVIACIEWALGRPSSVPRIPHWIAIIIEQVTGEE